MAGTAGSAGAAAPGAAGRRPGGLHEVVVLVLAAGEGRRLRPLTLVRPKPLCPVLDRPLLDAAIGRVEALDPARELPVVVNAHHGGALVVEHLAGSGALAGWVEPDGTVLDVAGDSGAETARARGGDLVDPSRGLLRPPLAAPAAPVPEVVDAAAAVASGGARPVLVSAEVDEALGTAGAIGRLVPWLDGRGVLVLNADTSTDVDLAPLLDGWDGTTQRVLVAGDGRFGPGAQVAGALVPWREAARLAATPSGLWGTTWRDAAAAGAVEAVGGIGSFVDCGTPERYLQANLDALAGVADGPDGSRLAAGATVTGRAVRSVVGAGAVVEGEVEGSVVWPGAHVHAGEHLRSAVRTSPTANGMPVTVVVR